MQGPYLRKYGAATTANFALFETDGVDFKVDAVHASGDTTIMKDEGAEANTTNGFVDEGQGYSIALTATEMEAARIVVYVVDQGTKAWLDTAIVIETYGHASAMHAFDLDTATVTPAAGSITATVVATGAIDADALAATGVTKIAGGVWNEPSTGHTDAGKAGAQLWTDIDAILADTGADGVAIADGYITAAKLATGAITSDELAESALNEIADAVLKRGVNNVEDVADNASLAELILAAFESAISGTSWVIKKTDGVTTFNTRTVTKDPDADPITGVT